MKKLWIVPVAAAVLMLAGPSASIADGGGNSDAASPLRPKIELSPDSILRAVDPATRQVMRQQLQMIDLLQKRPVVLLAPYVVTVK